MVTFETLPIAGFGGTAPNNGTAVMVAGTICMGKAPADANGGGYTILETFVSGKSGTCQVNLVDMGAAGTATTGTICAYPSVFTGGPGAGTPSGYWLDGGRYYGLEIAAGTIVGQAFAKVGLSPGR